MLRYARSKGSGIPGLSLPSSPLAVPKSGSGSRRFQFPPDAVDHASDGSPWPSAPRPRHPTVVQGGSPLADAASSPDAGYLWEYQHRATALSQGKHSAPTSPLNQDRQSTSRDKRRSHRRSKKRAHAQRTSDGKGDAVRSPTDTVEASGASGDGSPGDRSDGHHHHHHKHRHHKHHHKHRHKHRHHHKSKHGTHAPPSPINQHRGEGGGQPDGSPSNASRTGAAVVADAIDRVLAAANTESFYHSYYDARAAQRSPKAVAGTATTAVDMDSMDQQLFSRSDLVATSASAVTSSGGSGKSLRVSHPQPHASAYTVEDDSDVRAVAKMLLAPSSSASSARANGGPSPPAGRDYRASPLAVPGAAPGVPNDGGKGGKVPALQLDIAAMGSGHVGRKSDTLTGRSAGSSSARSAGKATIAGGGGSSLTPSARRTPQSSPPPDTGAVPLALEAGGASGAGATAGASHGQALVHTVAATTAPFGGPASSSSKPSSRTSRSSRRTAGSTTSKRRKGKRSKSKTRSSKSKRRSQGATKPATRGVNDSDGGGSNSGVVELVMASKRGMKKDAFFLGTK